MRRLLVCCVLLFCANARAATFIVDRLDDANVSTCSAAANDCTLRGAINAANTAAGNDTVTFGAAVTGILQLTGVLPDLSSNIDFQGPGATVLTVRGEGAADPYRIFGIGNNFIVTISGLTLANGRGINVGGGAILNNHSVLTLRNCVLNGNAGDDGGAIYSAASTGSGSLSVIGCTFNNNTGAFNAGAIYNDGFDGNAPLTVTNCTFAGNSTGGNGGAIYSNGGGGGAAQVIITGSTFTQNTANNGGGIVNSGGATTTLTVSNSTFNSNTATSGSGGGILNGGTVNLSSSTLSGNSASGFGGGIFSDANATLNVSNSIVAGNTAGTDGADISGSLASGDYNLVQSVSGVTLTGTQNITGQPALLGALSNNGGPTQTLALLAGSPAINAGNTSLTSDQRGFSRPSGTADDIGAFEAGSVPSLRVNNPRSLNEGSQSAPGSVTFDVTLSGASTQSVTVKYQTTNGINNPAIAGSDYVTKSGRLTFAPGETLKRVTISFVGDSVPELNETFFFDLNTPTNATIGDGRGVGAINNDDGPSITIEDNVINEGNSGTTAQRFTVRLSAASTTTITVDWTTANGTALATAEAFDYVAASGTLTFAPGQTSKIITILVNGDTKAEPDETYKMILSKPTYAVLADARAVGTIRNDDAIGLLFEDEPSQ